MIIGKEYHVRDISTESYFFYTFSFFHYYLSVLRQLNFLRNKLNTIIFP